MKKKFLLTFAIVTVLFCFFAISASAVQIYDDFDVTALENIEYRADDIIVFDDGFSCPSVYVFKDTKSIGKGQWASPDGLKNALDFTYINSKVAPKEYGFDDIDSIDIPQGVTSMGQYACNKLTTIRAISIPDTLVTFGGTCFQNASGLEYCVMEHGAESTLTTLPGTMFSGAGLKAFSMPDCIKTLNSGKEFENCKSMTAVYLSKNLTSIAGSNACFDYCGKMYFVNEPFVAKSESQIPAKPTIYYFPSNLSSLGGTAGAFRGSSSLNDVLVFGKKLTAVTNRVTFQGSPANTIVFLGDMTDVVAYETYYWGTKNLIFANPADKSASDLNTLALKSGTNNAYFCYGDGTAKHIKELTTTKDATCTLPAMTADFCFCGQYIPNTETTVGSALGHSHTIYNGIVYESYMAKGYKEYECDRCGDVNTDEEVPELFVCLGYSAPTFGEVGGIAIGYTVNIEAVEEYAEATGTTVAFGVFAVSKDKLGENEIFADDGTTANGVINAEISAKEFAAFELAIVGLTDEYKGAKLALGAYVAVTKDGATAYSYMQDTTKGEQSGKYYFASYNDIIG